MVLVIPPDISTAAVDRLALFPAFQTFVLEGLIGTDADDAAPDAEKLAKAWLFQNLDDEGRPFRDPEGSGKAAIVLGSRTHWTGANRHNTAKFPMLQMLIYVDSDRDEEGGVTDLNARRKCEFMCAELDKCFHLVGNEVEDQAWPGKDVHSCVRTGGFDIRDVPTTQSTVVRAEIRYETISD